MGGETCSAVVDGCVRCIVQAFTSRAFREHSDCELHLLNLNGANEISEAKARDKDKGDATPRRATRPMSAQHVTSAQLNGAEPSDLTCRDSRPRRLQRPNNEQKRLRAAPRRAAPRALAVAAAAAAPCVRRRAFHQSAPHFQSIFSYEGSAS